MTMKPEKIAKSGDAISDKTILPMPMKFSPVLPVETSTAPIMPPTSACEELLGIATYQVKRFQTTDPMRAAMMICSSTISALATMSPPIVFATPVL